jgi:hypothetical protein
MTEQEWLNCTEPALILDWLPNADRVSERSFRLVAAAFFRNIWGLLDEEYGRRRVETLERYADLETAGLATPKHRETMLFITAIDLPEVGGLQKHCFFGLGIDAKSIAAGAQRFAAESVVMRFGTDEPDSSSPEVLAAYNSAWERECVIQCALIRDIFGNPFQPLPRIEPSCVNSNVVGIAKAIYQERQFDQLAVLGDALEDMGCTNTDILWHLRSPGPHVRGCWCLESILEMSGSPPFYNFPTFSDDSPG